MKWALRAAPTSQAVLCTAGHCCCRSLPQEEEAKKLVSEAIAAGIFNDLGSGSNIDLCVISKSKLDFLRPYSVPNKKGTR